MLSFTNFFYVLNSNLEEEDPKLAYFDPHTGVDAIDSFIMVYLAGAVGNFNPLWYCQGEGVLQFFAVPMFVLTIFFCNVVFMNMLVAIMG